MPNWCVNRLSVVGKMRHIKKIQDQILVENPKSEQIYFKFNNVIKMPEELDLEESTVFSTPHEILFGESYETAADLTNQENAEEPVPFVVPPIIVEGYGEDRCRVFKVWVARQIRKPGSQEEFNKACFKYEKKANIRQMNITNFGHASWYDWRIDNWGTKWDACDCSIMQELIVPPEGGDGDSPNAKAYVKYEFNTAWGPPIPIIKKLGQMFPKVKFKLRYFECGAGFQGTLVIKKGEVLIDESGEYNGSLGG
jgi:hypothetical protein